MTNTFTEQLRALQQPPSSFLEGLHLQPCSRPHSPVLRSQEEISLQYSELSYFLEHTYLLSSLHHRLGYSFSPLFIKDFSSWIPRLSHLQHPQHSYPKSKVLRSNNSSCDWLPPPIASNTLKPLTWTHTSQFLILPCPDQFEIRSCFFQLHILIQLMNKNIELPGTRIGSIHHPLF